LLELSVAALRRAFAWSRARASFTSGLACWIIGLATVFSFNLWSGWYPLSAVPLFATASVFDLIDHLTSNILLPVSGFGIAIFAGWVIPRHLLGSELRLRGAKLAVLRWLLRYPVPIGIAAATLAPLF
jgi:neurotransmitter:Na+ symporter, NSS family